MECRCDESSMSRGVMYVPNVPRPAPSCVPCHPTHLSMCWCVVSAMSVWCSVIESWMRNSEGSMLFVGAGHLKLRPVVDTARGIGAGTKAYFEVPLYKEGGVEKVATAFVSARFTDDRVASAHGDNAAVGRFARTETVFHGDVTAPSRARYDEDDDPTAPLGKNDVARRFGRSARIAHAARRAAERTRGRRAQQQPALPPAAPQSASRTKRDKAKARRADGEADGGSGARDRSRSRSRNPDTGGRDSASRAERDADDDDEAVRRQRRRAARKQAKKAAAIAAALEEGADTPDRDRDARRTSAAADDDGAETRSTRSKRSRTAKRRTGEVDEEAKAPARDA